MTEALVKNFHLHSHHLPVHHRTEHFALKLAVHLETVHFALKQALHQEKGVIEKLLHLRHTIQKQQWKGEQKMHLHLKQSIQVIARQTDGFPTQDKA